MTYTDFVRRSLTVVAIIVLTGIGLLVAYQALSIVMIGFFCWIISVGLDQPINALRRRGAGRNMAVLATFAGTAIVIVLFILIVLPPLITQINNLLAELPNAAEFLVQKYADLRTANATFSQVLPEFTVENLHNLFGPTAETQAVDISTLDVGGIVRSTLPVLVDFGSFLGNLLVNSFMVLFVSSYLVLDPMIYYRMIVAVIPSAHEARAIEIINKMRRAVVTWLGALAVSTSFTGISVALVLGVFLRIPNAIALGSIAALGNVIPNVGYYLALIPIGLFSVASAGPTQALLAILAYIVIGEIEAKVISPTMIKNELHIPAGLMLLFQLVAARLLGFFGILLAVPLLAMVITVVREVYVRDSLGKFGGVPEITETLDGRLVLHYAAEQGEEQKAPERHKA